MTFASKIYIVFLFLVILPGCQTDFIDVSDTSIKSATSVNTPVGNYQAVAWLARDRFAFIYSPQQGVRDEYNIYALELGNLNKVEIPTEDISGGCNKVTPIIISRLPSQNLGTIVQCSFWQGSVSNRHRTLYSLDDRFLVSGKYRYSDRLDVTQFEISPSSDAWLQSADSTGGLDTDLFLYQNNDMPQELFPDFARVRAGSFSPEGNLIAFVGTETEPVLNLGIFTFTLSIQHELDYPWSLYITDQNGTPPEEVVTGIQYANNVKWSSDGDNIAFVGNYKNQDGIWIFNVESQTIYRVWHESVLYDWSPEGDRIVLLSQQNDGVSETQIPLIVSISDIFSSE